jgi:LuxR family maltose regulon positive regulatory protein
VSGSDATAVVRRTLSTLPSVAARAATILRDLPTDLRLREVAGTLYVSLNTVKSQTRAIYRKVGVTTRDEAVVRARQLGLA